MGAGDRRLLRSSASGQRGHLLVGLMVLIAVMLIMLTVAGQSWTFLIRRDAEAELIFRGEQYANALEFYKKENATYPLELEVLAREGPHRHRYIRKLYPDPLAKDGKWGKLYLSPDGKGFINPFASRSNLDPFAADGLEPLDLPGQQGPGQRPWGKQDQEIPPGYTQDDTLGLDERGGEMQGMPIVGVVHKQRETGVKIYKTQASLNDWAFTLMVIDPKLQPTAMHQPAPNVPLAQGVGDIHRPIFLGRVPGQGPPGQASPLTKIKEMREKSMEEWRKKKEKEREEALARRRAKEQPPDQDETYEDPPPEEDEAPADQEGQEDAGDEGETEEAEPEDPNAPADPNGAVDPNAPAPEEPPNAP